MLPSEFIARYGRCDIKRYGTPAGAGWYIPPDDHRSLFAIWGTAQGYVVYPDFQNGVEFDGVNTSPTIDPFVLSFTNHGQLVCLGFTIIPLGVPATLTLITARMQPRSGKPGVPVDARTIRSVKADDGDRSKSRSRRG